MGPGISGRCSVLTASLVTVGAAMGSPGKIIEHCDVLQVIPETSANDNGMF